MLCLSCSAMPRLCELTERSGVTGSNLESE